MRPVVTVVAVWVRDVSDESLSLFLVIPTTLSRHPNKKVRTDCFVSSILFRARYYYSYSTLLTITTSPSIATNDHTRIHFNPIRPTRQILFQFIHIYTFHTSYSNIPPQTTQSGLPNNIPKNWRAYSPFCVSIVLFEVPSLSLPISLLIFLCILYVIFIYIYFTVQLKK